VHALYLGQMLLAQALGEKTAGLECLCRSVHAQLRS
jgi:hypothetical protein